MDVEAIRKRYGLFVRSHRIGDMDLRLAEVERPDEMVREVYPDAVTEHGDAPVWMITWPASLALAEHLALCAGVRGKRILELGCGTAAPGIAAERAGARVISTDYDPLALRMAGYNALLNGCQTLETRRLDWYHPDLDGRFDLVVGSEVVYFEKSFAPLLDVLARTSAPDGRTLLADQGRPQMDVFLKLCPNAGFRCQTHRRVVHLPDRSQTIRIVELFPDHRS
jgi:predicted nicotinamide N-methyase